MMIHNNLNKLFLTFFLFVTSFSLLNANEYWKRNYTKADEIAAKTKKINNIEKLSKQLTADLTETVDKYRAIFTWVALNISYDCNAFKKDDYSNLEAEDVLSKGKSVCQGYAALFDALCEKSGLKCETTDGWTKNLYTKIGTDIAPVTTHAWNVIYIDKRWYLVDVTWAAGSTEGNCDKFLKEFSGFYFCTPPSIFNLNHYPREEKWLLGENISKSEFQNLPHFYKIALENNIRDVKPPKGIIKAGKNTRVDFQFTIDLPLKNIILKQGNSEQVQVKFTQTNGKVNFSHVISKKPGYLTIYLNTKGALVYKIE